VTSNWQNLRDKVAYFVHFHLDTARKCYENPTEPQIQLYTVEGKARPMLVIGQSRDDDTRKTWYVVLKITTKGLTANGKPKENFESIGDCLERGRNSFVELTPLRYAENLLTSDIGGSVIANPIDTLAIQNVLRIVRHKLQGGGGQIARDS
jgi:hypothetical protein